MAFRTMIVSLIEQGLLDQDHNMTPKGHEYVEKIKQELRAKTISAEERSRTKQEKVPWPTKWT